MASTHASSMGAINLKVCERGLYPHIGDIEMYKEAGMLSTLRMKFHLKVFKISQCCQSTLSAAVEALVMHPDILAELPTTSKKPKPPSARVKLNDDEKAQVLQETRNTSLHSKNRCFDEKAMFYSRHQNQINYIKACKKVVTTADVAEVEKMLRAAIEKVNKWGKQVKKKSMRKAQTDAEQQRKNQVSGSGQDREEAIIKLNQVSLNLLKVYESKGNLVPSSAASFSTAPSSSTALSLTVPLLLPSMPAPTLATEYAELIRGHIIHNTLPESPSADADVTEWERYHLILSGIQQQQAWSMDDDDECDDTSDKVMQLAFDKACQQMRRNIGSATAGSTLVLDDPTEGFAAPTEVENGSPGDHDDWYVQAPSNRVACPMVDATCTMGNLRDWEKDMEQLEKNGRWLCYQCPKFIHRPEQRGFSQRSHCERHIEVWYDLELEMLKTYAQNKLFHCLSALCDFTEKTAKEMRQHCLSEDCSEQDRFVALKEQSEQQEKQVKNRPKGESVRVKMCALHQVDSASSDDDGVPATAFEAVLRNCGQLEAGFQNLGLDGTTLSTSLAFMSELTQMQYDRYLMGDVTLHQENPTFS
ncbi:hypothetical protein BKA93DRAFT_823060 [Sparassis latifolia]